jgi:hypothetical protein
MPFRKKLILTISGILFSIIVLEISLRLGGFIYLSWQQYRNTLSARQNHTYRIMCLGESTTAMGGENSYPAQLEKILNQRNLGIKFSVINRGVNAVTTSYILAHLKENIEQYNPQMVITMMGVGDKDPTIYRDISSEKGLTIFDSLRICTLARLLWLHILAKAKEKLEVDPGKSAFCKNINISEAEMIKRRNYREVKRILDRRKIKLVCVQYPMLQLLSLKAIFNGQNGVIFVDNENIFKEAVQKSGYQKYFTDSFGVEFGHCTAEGNRLLAQNLANVILKEYFNIGTK